MPIKQEIQEDAIQRMIEEERNPYSSKHNGKIVIVLIIAISIMIYFIT